MLLLVPFASFMAEWFFKPLEEFEIWRRFYFENSNLTIFKHFGQTVPQIDKFGLKSCQKKHEDMSYQLLEEFFVSERLAIKKFVQYIVLYFILKKT